MASVGNKRKRENGDEAPGDDRPLKVRVAEEVAKIRSTDTDGKPRRYDNFWLPVTIAMEVGGAVTEWLQQLCTEDTPAASAAESSATPP